jgi:hypothetical protein
VIDFLHRNVGDFQAISHRLYRKSGAMLLSIEPFLFDRGEKLAIFGDGSGGVAVIGINSQNVQTAYS